MYNPLLTTHPTLHIDGANLQRQTAKRHQMYLEYMTMSLWLLFLLPTKNEKLVPRYFCCRAGNVKEKGGDGGDSGEAQETIIGGSMVSTYQTVPQVEKDGKKELLAQKEILLNTQLDL